MAKRKREAASGADARATVKESVTEQTHSDEVAAKRRRSERGVTHVASSTIPSAHGTTIHYYKLDAISDYHNIDVSSKEAITKVCIKDLVIHVPKGHQGRLMLELDLPSSSSTSPRSEDWPDSTHSVVRINLAESGVVLPHSRALTAPTLSSSADESRSGFLKLPTELRDAIYSEVFVAKRGRGIMPFSHNEISLSAGSFALAGKCTTRVGSGFTLRCRGDFWEPKWASLGYETMHVFFKTIGAANTRLLRNINICLDDATRTGIPYTTPEERRYIYDEHLIGS